MYKNDSKYCFIVLIVVVAIFSNFITRPTSAEHFTICEVQGRVTKIVDGDTIDVYVVAIFIEKYIDLHNKVIRVRFADINAPELSTVEGLKVKNVVSSLLNTVNYTVCLNIDDLGDPTDRYNRYISLVYIPHNETHWLSLNKWLIDNGYVEIMDFEDNEFDPTSWSLFTVINLGEPIVKVNENKQKNYPNLPISNEILLLISASILVITALLFYLSKYSTRWSMRASRPHLLNNLICK